ncbi:c-type cytochrome [Telluribacter sp. SYSU D00476]|uniref:c-type cytochrome n=1 Tax=Telluribacter sp. SYSU D00476 TaxID=2811430 RepID=UPI001FF554C1|nr:c-type cytochrome [Telluribacter sp. SYSU D00476]
MKTVKKIGKWTSIGILCLLGILLIAYGFVYWNTEQSLNKVYPTQSAAIRVEYDSASISHGAQLYLTKGCKDCHEANLGGKVFMNDPMVAVITAPNLTKGQGGISEDFTTNDWIRTLKHGVDRKGKPLLLMPSHETTKMTDEDMADLIAYCQQQPPINNPLPREQQLGPVGRVLVVLEQATLLAAEKIDHTPTPVAHKTPEPTAEYGAYLAVSCQGCHRENMEGGAPLAPGFPPVPNITAGGNPGKWSEEEFIRTLRSGTTPEKKHLRNEYMPWQNIAAHTDVELKALYAYLTSLPANKTVALNSIR